MYLEQAEPTKKRIKLSGYMDISPINDVPTCQEVVLTIKGQFEDYSKKFVKGGEDIRADYKFTPDCSSINIDGKDIEVLIEEKGKEITDTPNE